MGTPMYTQGLQSFLREYQGKLKEIQAQGKQQRARRLQCTITRLKQLLMDAGASFDSDESSS